MYNNISIIGLGTIGGFLAENLSELETTKQLTLVDFDTVEKENIKNSVYIKEDIGKLKTEAIINKLNPDVEVLTLNMPFKEEVTELPKSDLTLDCRDFTYDRKNVIDLRLYISYRNLIMDCRKNITYDIHHEGKYIEKLSKTDLRNASLTATLLISNGIIKELIDNQLVHKVQLDYASKNSKDLIKNYENKTDIVYDFNSFDKKLLNLQENFKNIIHINKSNQITLFLGSKNSPYFSKKFSSNNFVSINDIISKFSSVLIRTPYPFNYYIISLFKENGEYFIELIPETGSA